MEELERLRQSMPAPPPIPVPPSMIYTTGDITPFIDTGQISMTASVVSFGFDLANQAAAQAQWGESPAITAFGQLRRIRKRFKEYSKEEFRNMSKEPVIKDILSGSHKLTEEEKQERIKEHLDNIL
jgi:hypothetical protein